MTMKRMIWLVVASVSLWEVGVAAEDEFGFDDEEDEEENYEHHVEVGIANTGSGNGKFGEYAKELDENGSFVVGSVRLGKDTQAGLLYLFGSKNEFGSVYELGINRPGTFSMEIFGSNSQKVEFGEALTLYPYDTGGHLELPEGFTDSADLDMYGYRDLKIERSTTGLSMSKVFGSNWTANFEYQVQDKEGEKSSTGSQGFRGTGIIVEPVDYQHDELTLGVEYSLNRLALGVGYYVSELENKEGSLTFPNPNFDGIGLEELTLPPDNEFRRFDFDGSYRLGDRTMVNWFLNWSEAEQNDGFRPYALDTGYYGGEEVFSPFAVAALQGDVHRFNSRLTLVSRVNNNFSYKIEYSRRDRESDHDPYLWDALSYSGRVSSLSAPSHVYDKDSETVKLEGGYRFVNRTKIKFGWRRDNVDRTRAEVEHLADSFDLIKGTDKTEEDTFWINYRFSIVANLNVALRVEQFDRDADTSQERIAHLHFVSEDEDGNLEAEGENTLPFYLAGRDGTRYMVNADIPLGQLLMLSGGFTLSDEDYDDDFDGLLSREIQSLNLDLSYNARKNLYITVYGLRQNFEWDQDGTTSSGSGSVGSLWETKGEDESTVIGASIDWEVVPRKLHITADMSASRNDSEVTSYDRLNQIADQLPVYGTDVTRLDISAMWQLRAQTVVQLRYLYEDWESNDYTWDGELLDGIAFGWRAPDEAGQAVFLSVKQEF